jgi:hypothetical protein
MIAGFLQLIDALLRRLFACPVILMLPAIGDWSISRACFSSIRLDSCEQPVACRLDLMCLAGEMLFADKICMGRTGYF